MLYVGMSCSIGLYVHFACHMLDIGIACHERAPGHGRLCLDGFCSWLGSLGR